MHAYEIPGCDCEIHSNARTGVQSDTGCLGWFWVNSSLPCYGLLHLIALVCSDLNISGIDFGFLWLVSPFRKEPVIPEISWFLVGLICGTGSGKYSPTHHFPGRVQFSLSVVSDSLQPLGLQHTRPPCLSSTSGACSHSCPLSWWCHPTIYSLTSSSPPAFHLPQHQGLFQWVSSLQQVAKVLEFQLQHQSFPWILRTDFL